MIRRLSALLVLGACTAFGADPPAPTPATTDGGAADASPVPDGAPSLVDAAAKLACPTGALQCEDFEQADYASGWTTKPTQIMKLAPDEDPVHGGVGKVLIDARTWDFPLEDALGREFPLDGKAATVSLDFLVRVDRFAQAQIVEVAKLVADHFLVRLVLAASADDVVSLDLSTFSRDTNAQITTPTQVGVIRDHAWHAVHLELRTSDLPTVVQGELRASLDTEPPRGGAVPAPEGNTTTHAVRYVVGISYLADFRGPAHYAIDEVVATARP